MARKGLQSFGVKVEVIKTSLGVIKQLSYPNLTPHWPRVYCMGRGTAGHPKPIGVLKRLADRDALIRPIPF
jgi:hypothetical protein